MSSKREKPKEKPFHSLFAGATAGAIEAFRVRNGKGSWTGERGARVATVAIGAAATDMARDKDPDKHGKRDYAQATLAGMALNRLTNGSRK